MLKQKSILQAGSQESIFEIRIKSVLKLTRRGAALLVS